MCPACMASAAVVAGSVVSTGGVTALAVKIFRSKRSGQTKGSNNIERSTDHGDSGEQRGTDGGGVAR